VFRTRRMPRFAVAAALVTASLSLAACQSGTGVEKEGRASAERPTAPAARDDVRKDAPAPAAPAAHQRPDDRAGGQSGRGDDGSAAPERCGPSNTELTVRPVPRPVNHLLLTVTNTGTTACNAYGHPFLRFDEAQAPTPALEESRPQAVTTLRPGESAYAGITTSSAAGDDDAVPATRLGVLFADQDGGAGEDGPVTLTLPEDTRVGTAARVTYWLSDPADALAY